MKLIYCPFCLDIFNLSFKRKTCSCGKCYGEYVNNVQAQVSADSISLGLGNGAFNKAILIFYRLRSTLNQEDREFWQKTCHINYFWVRPNEGPGNPHTHVIKEKEND